MFKRAAFAAASVIQRTRLIILLNVVTLLLSDDDFGKLVKGTAKAQSLFMAGKLKIRGDIMKATRLEPILGKAQTKAKL